MNPFARTLITFMLILLLIALFGACTQLSTTSPATPTPTGNPTPMAGSTPYPVRDTWSDLSNPVTAPPSELPTQIPVPYP